jgi:succinyl-diaminopimelate desuccinylase
MAITIFAVLSCTAVPSRLAALKGNKAMEKNAFETVSRKIDTYRDEAIELQKNLTAIPALGPENGGEGELKKADFLLRYLKGLGIQEIVDVPAQDARVPCGYRPNVIATVGPSGAGTTWIMAHMDVVPPGDLKMWETDPFQAVVKRGKIFGRGVEDNHQAIVCGLLVMKAVIESGVELRSRLGLVLVSDEETGSHYGLAHVLKEKKGVFRRRDFILVPDAGEPDGSKIEVAEKSILWLKFTTRGKQCHASTPDKGINAFRAGSALAGKLDDLHRLFPKKDKVFEPPQSTFEPTKKEANVPNINTIPGEDVFYLDCRVLPIYKLADVKKKIRTLTSAIEKRHRVKIAFESAQEAQAAPPTAADAPVVGALQRAIREVYRIKAVPIGIGGGTVAAIFRKAGFSTAVWSKLADMAHQPNEYCSIDNLLGDSKVFAHVFLQAP